MDKELRHKEAVMDIIVVLMMCYSISLTELKDSLSNGKDLDI